MNTRLTAAARTVRGTFVASLKGQLRFYTFSGWMVSSLLSPVFLLASAAVIARLVAGDGVPARFHELTGYTDYLAFVVLGLATTGLVASALEDGGNAVYEEESTGTWDLLALTPMNRFVWMFSKTLAGMVSSLLDVLIVIGVGAVLFDVRFSLANAGVALAALALTVVALQGFGFLMAAAGLLWKQPYALSMLLTPAIIFVSGMVFPVEALPGWLQRVAAVFPLTHGLEAVRDALLLGQGFAELAPVFGRLALTGGILMAAGFWAFRRMERTARLRGALGKY